VSPLVCVLCGSTGPLEAHHPTRRMAPADPYLDKQLRIMFCRGCHNRAHDVLRDESLDWPSAGANVLAYRLRTLAVLIGWLARAERSFVLADESACLRMQRLLLDGAEAIEARELVGS